MRYSEYGNFIEMRTLVATFSVGATSATAGMTLPSSDYAYIYSRIISITPNEDDVYRYIY